MNANMRMVMIASAVFMTRLAATPAVAAVDCCFVDDPTQTRCSVSPIQSNQELPGGVCGHTITGINCLLQIKSDVTVLQGSPGGSNCLTLGAGVTVDMENHTFRCNPTAYPLVCGSAFVIAGSGSTTGKVSILNGVFTGCWQNGAIRRSSGGGTNHSVENVTIDGAVVASCGSTGNGIDNISTVDEVLVKNTKDFGVRLDLPGARIGDSIIRNNTTGITSNGSSGQVISNVLLLGNGTAINKTANTSSTISTKSSVIRGSTGCNCVRAGVCDPACNQTQLLGFTGDSTFVEDDIR